MAKEQTFEQPPKGHVALLCYDPVNDRWQVVHVDADGKVQVALGGDGALEAHIYGYDGADWQALLAESATDPNLRVRLFGGATPVSVALTNADDRSVNYGALAVIGQVYGYDGAAWDRIRADDGALRVGQPTYADLKATTRGTLRIPAGVTDLTTVYQAANLANSYYLEALSGTTASTLAGLDGRVVASGKRLCVCYEACSARSTSGYLLVGIGYDSTFVFYDYVSPPSAKLVPNVIYECPGNGAKEWKVFGGNITGGTLTTNIAAIMWEEDVD